MPKKITFIYILCIITTLQALGKDSINIALPAKIDQFIPLNTIDTFTSSIIKYIYDPLFYLDPQTGFSSRIFSQWEKRKHGKEYLFTLNKNLHFHNGKEVTSADIKYTILNAYRKKASSLQFLNTSLEIDIIDKLTIKVKLEKESNLFFHVLTDQRLSVVPKNLLGKKETEFNKNPVGTGTFRFESLNNENLVLKRATTLKNKPSFLKFYFINSPDRFKEITSSLNIHDFNLFLLSFKEKVSKNISKNKFHSFNFPILSTRILAMNFKKNIIKDIKIRNILYHLFKDIDIVRFFDPNGVKATGFIPKGMIGHQENIYKNTLSMKEICNKTGKTPKRTIILESYLNKEQNRVLQNLLNDKLKFCETIKIKVSYNEDINSWMKKIESKKFDISVLVWNADHSHPVFLISPMQSLRKLNYFSISDPILDKKIANYRGGVMKEDSKYFNDLDNYIIENRYIIPMSYSNMKYYFHKKIKNYKINTLGPTYIDYSNAFFSE